MQSIHAYKIGR